MNYLKISNKGEIDINALILLGATSKEGDQTKIGFFGSGNKYAIATLLRNDCEVIIHSGEKQFIITTKDVDFRGVDYKQIVIDGVETSLTTRTGPAWEVWMALREFYCNAMDEGDFSAEVVKSVTFCDKGMTSIYVTINEVVQEFLDNLGDYINDKEVLVSVHTGYGNVDILNDTTGAMYRKNICCVNEKHLSLFGYNFNEIPINESRVVYSDYRFYERIASALAVTEDESIIRKYISGFSGVFEKDVAWSNNYCLDALSETWHSVLLSLKLSVISKSMSQIVCAEDVMNTAIILPDSLVVKIKEEYPDVPMYGVFDSQSIEAEPSVMLKATVEGCMRTVEDWGMKAMPVSYRKFVQESTMAMMYKGNIYISVDIPLDEVLHAIFEEMTHIHTGFSDGTRSLQSWLFKELIEAKKTIVSLMSRREELNLL